MTAKDPRFKPVAIRSPRGGRTTEIDWADGHKGVYPHAMLRGYCPCAGCQGHSGEIRFIEPRDDQQQLDEHRVRRRLRAVPRVVRRSQQRHLQLQVPALALPVRRRASPRPGPRAATLPRP